MNQNNEVDTILRELAAVRVKVMPDEYDIHDAVFRCLTEAGLCPEHEYKLGPRCRIDFKVGRTGLEIKKGRPVRSALITQLGRYLSSDELDRVIVITQQNVPLPASICGKPVIACPLNRLWGVALP